MSGLKNNILGWKIYATGRDDPHIGFSLSGVLGYDRKVSVVLDPDAVGEETATVGSDFFGVANWRNSYSHGTFWDEFAGEKYVDRVQTQHWGHVLATPHVRRCLPHFYRDCCF